MPIDSLIQDKICELVANSNTRTKYREPLIGFADATDPLFAHMRNFTHQEHFKPQDLLPTAKTVVAFFIPFTSQLVEANRRHEYVSEEWARAYVETNALINDVCDEVKIKLAEKGVKCATVAATHNFDEEILMSYWSHRHAAYAAGLGTFGLNNMLITSKGCAGRYGSFVMDAVVVPTPRPKEEFCLYKLERGCTHCIDLCPVGALKIDGFDRQKCYEHLLKVQEYYKDIGNCDVCGKCNNAVCAIY